MPTSWTPQSGQSIHLGDEAPIDSETAKAPIDWSKATPEQLDAAQKDRVAYGESVMSNAGGIYGFFGGEHEVPLYAPQAYEDPNYASNRALLESMRTGVAGQPNRTLAMPTGDFRSMAGSTYDTSLATRGRGDQQRYIEMLRRSASGTGGPSVAQMQLQRGTDRNMAQALALASSAQGVNPALAMRQAQNARASASQDAAGQSAELRMREMQDAQRMLGGALEGMRSQDLGAVSAFRDRAAMAQDAAKTNLSAALEQDRMRNDLLKTDFLSQVEQDKMRNELVSRYVAQGLSLDQANIQAKIQQEQYTKDALARQVAAANGVTMQAGQQQTQAMGTAMQTLGTIALAASDRRAKKNITDGEEESLRFLKALRPHGFEYKDEKFGKGHHLGVMAQDVERAAPDLIVDDTDGVKKIDIRKALSASLASLGTIDRRLERLEGARA